MSIIPKSLNDALNQPAKLFDSVTGSGKKRRSGRKRKRRSFKTRYKAWRSRRKRY